MSSLHLGWVAGARPTTGENKTCAGEGAGACFNDCRPQPTVVVLSGHATCIKVMGGWLTASLDVLSVVVTGPATMC